MSEALRIRRNSLFSLISSVARLVANFFLFWLIARKYSEEVYGQFKLAQSLATNFLFLADFGFDILLTTEIAKNKDKAQDYFSKLFTLKLALSLIAILSMWCIALFSNISFDTKILIFIFSFFMFFSAHGNFLFAYFKGFEKLQYETTVSIFINLFLLVATVVLALSHSSILLISIVFLFTRVAAFIFTIGLKNKVDVPFQFRISFSGLSTFKNKILIFGFFLLFNNLFFQIDTLFLGFWKGEYEVGVYQSVFMLILLPLIIPDILTNALMPVLARFHSENNLLWEKTSKIFNKVLSICALPISLILFLYSKQIVTLLYGNNKYTEAIPILKLLAITLLIRFSFESFSLMLTTSNRQKVRMWTVIFVTAFNISLNYYFIHEYGIIGAAIVSVLSNILIVFVNAYIFKKLLFDWFFNIKQLGLYFISLIVFLAGYYIDNINFIVGSVIILIIYSSIAYLLYFTEEEKKLLFSSDYGINLLRRK